LEINQALLLRKGLLTKINYRIHTDAIKENLIPSVLSPAQINQVYASEADILNMALFGITAAVWRKANPDKKGNISSLPATLQNCLFYYNSAEYTAVRPFCRRREYPPDLPSSEGVSAEIPTLTGSGMPGIRSGQVIGFRIDGW
jgi:hypothetical protein